MIRDITVGESEWEGWGTALKPAQELFTLARKPLSEKTVAANVLKWGTGAINIDGSRVEINPEVDDKRLGGNGTWSSAKMAKNVYEGGYAGNRVTSHQKGRFPANVIHDGHQLVLDLFPHTKTGAMKKHYEYKDNGQSMGKATGITRSIHEANEGSAARFFYCAKASKNERNKGMIGKELDFFEFKIIIGDEILWKEKIMVRQEFVAKRLVAMEQSQRKAIEEFGIKSKNESEWNIISCGKKILEKYLQDTKCIIKTKISLTTFQQISNLLHLSITKGCIQDVSSLIMNGGNLVVNEENLNTFTIIINEKMGFLHGVNPVALKVQLKIKEQKKQNFHSTVKPIRLMEYLVKLITPPNGIVLDCYAGSGSTGIACQNLGFDCVLIERDEAYCEIINNRVNA